MSKPDKKSKIPEAPVPLGGPGGSGNLLSSVAPPSALPNFMTASPPITIIPQETPKPALIPTPVSNIDTHQEHNVEPQQPSPEYFSPAIPLNKGEPLQSIRSPEDSQASQSPESLPSSTSELDALGDVMPGSGLLTWVKGAVSTGGLLHRVAEKAKSSVDSMITTLDPQMKEYLNSGGDIYVVVASDKDIKISPIREAFQAVFLKATVIGCAAQSSVTAAQPVGYAAAYAAAKQRIAHVRSTRADLTNHVPVVAVEGFIAEAIPDRWYEQSLLVLSRPSLALELHALSQGCALPAAAAAAARAATPADYPHSATGYSLPIGAVMSDSLQVTLRPPPPATPADYPHSATGYSLPIGAVMSDSLQVTLRPPPPATPADYPHSATGYSLPIGAVMADSLQVPRAQWQEACAGVSRRETLALAARALAGAYKRQLAISAAEA